MKAGEELKFNGKTYLATLNLVQILSKSSSCEGCAINHKPSISMCPMGKSSKVFLCGNPDTQIDEQVIFVEKV